MLWVLKRTIPKQMFKWMDKKILLSLCSIFFWTHGYSSIFRWLGFRLEVLGGIVVVIAALFAVLERETITGALVGLSISYALQVT